MHACVLIYIYCITSKKIIKLTTLVVRQKVVMDQAGPQMESIDIADNRLSRCERTTTIALHLGQTYVEYLKCTTLMYHMPQKQ